MSERRTGSEPGRNMTNNNSFFGGVKKEWKKITWLSKDKVRSRTMLTLLASILIAAAVSGVDTATMALLNMLRGII